MKINWRQIKVPPILLLDDDQLEPRMYIGKGRHHTILKVLISCDGGMMHMSVSAEKRNPFWEELTAARYDLLSEVPYMIMVLPPKEEYVNFHKNCFHFFESHDPTHGAIARELYGDSSD